MNKTQGAAAPFALAVGTFYIVEGIWGMFSPITFGVLSTNKMHAMTHIAMGILGIYAARSTYARLWCMLVGVIVLIVGACWFVPAVNGLVLSLFNLNRAVATMNIVIGVAAILVAQVSHARSGLRPS